MNTAVLATVFLLGFVVGMLVTAWVKMKKRQP